MRQRVPVALSVVLFFAAAIDSHGAEIEFETGRPGNLFAHGKPVSIRVKLRVPGDLEWRVTNLDEEEVGAGKTRDRGVVGSRGSVSLGSRDFPYSLLA